MSLFSSFLSASKKEQTEEEQSVLGEQSTVGVCSSRYRDQSGCSDPSLACPWRATRKRRSGQIKASEIASLLYKTLPKFSHIFLQPTSTKTGLVQFGRNACFQTTKIEETASVCSSGRNITGKVLRLTNDALRIPDGSGNASSLRCSADDASLIKDEAITQYARRPHKSIETLRFCYLAAEHGGENVGLGDEQNVKPPLKVAKSMSG
ncbi:hypothetical protein JTE90_006698 [Oedothorax gibbosus]|uniref:Uncharacterized protein n=1 Tax=Oedothorax gibbosus TaxID=931172 RepID=A0AAV6TXM8_9ARAC|nr:hypothetical protein JTE90_006698 [Oedothorax gibbosus]